MLTEIRYGNMRARVKKLWILGTISFVVLCVLFSLSLRMQISMVQFSGSSLLRQSFTSPDMGTLSPSIPILEEPGGVALCDLPWFVEERQAASTKEQAELLHLCRNAGILTVQQGGRLGNQMWEYASVWGLSKEVPLLTPVVPRCLLRAIDDAFPFLTLPELKNSILQRGCNSGINPQPEPTLSHQRVLQILQECQDGQKGLECVDKNPRCCKRNMVLERWIALPELVLPRLNMLRAQEFRFHSYLNELAASFLTAVKQKTGASVFISVHIRRGDYSEYLSSKHNASLAPAAYYEEAMSRFHKNMKEKLAFVIISDDIQWCRANIVPLRKDIFVAWDAVGGWKESTENLAGVPESDLALMAQSNHTVLDYGSFGTWGALLSGGKTIVYGIDGLLSTKVAKLLAHWEIVPSGIFY